MTRTNHETMSAVRDLMRCYGRELIAQARRDYRAERAVDLTYATSHLRVLGHSHDSIDEAQEYVLSCARLPRCA